VEKADGEVLGCHTTKQAAIDQMVAVSIAEGIEPGGETSREVRQEEEILVVDIDGTLLAGGSRPMEDVIAAVNASEYPVVLLTGREEASREETVQQLSDAGIAYVRLIMNEGSTEPEAVATYKQNVIRMLLDEGYEIDAFVDNSEMNRAAVESLGVDVYSPDEFVAEEMADEMEEPMEDGMEYESRAIKMVAPDFMAESARRGLDLHEAGESGEGLRPQTVEDARKMANGEILSEAKWRKIGPWIARHIVDLDAVDGDEITPGLVAMLLWGGGSTRESARRAQNYAEGIVRQMDEERKRIGYDKRSAHKDNTMTDTATIAWVTVPKDERRSVAYSNLEVRAMEDSTKLIGYAAVFDSPSEPLPWTEYVRRGAFTKTLNDGADVRLLIDHEGIPLARSKSGTLKMMEDERGLRVEADLDPTNPDAQRVLSAMRRGDMTQMSFAFRTIKDSWNKDRSVRELKEVQLYDVSIVTFPAYEETVAELRKKSDEAIVKSASNLLLRKNQLAIARHKQPD
jgi:HK97 family phage prohead protease